MAGQDDKDSKTEAATEKKMRDALDKGNTPFAKEMTAFASLGAIWVALAIVLGGSFNQFKSTLSNFIDNPGGIRLERAADAVNLMYGVGADALALLAPLVLILAFAGIAASLVQNVPRLVLDRIRPQASRLSITKGWSRIFGAKGQIEFVKATFKLGAAGLIGILSLQAAQVQILNAMFIDPAAIPALTNTIAARFVGWLLVATVVLVAADLLWSRLFWQRELRMSRQEIKDEMKQTEGDPILKARQQSLARDRARRRMIAQVPRATVVIANPTHYAIALRYVRDEGGAPLVVARGRDLVALKIREIAEVHAIPVVEDKLLAGSLYKAVQVDKMIPSEFYQAVASIIFMLTSRGGPKPAGH